MAIVWDQITGPGGSSLAGRDVVVRLIVPAFDATAKTSIASSTPATIAPNGRWALDLDPNDALTPAGTYYTLQEPDSPDQQQFVLDSSDPPEGGWWVKDLLTVDPPQPGSTPINVPDVLAQAEAAAQTYTDTREASIRADVASDYVARTGISLVTDPVTGETSLVIA